jgi:Na+/H+ antiporter NhaD/arsenite permease-like protein
MEEPEKVGVVGTKKEFAIFLGSVVGIGVVLYYLLGDMKQTLGGTIFLATVIGTLMFWRFRVAIAFLGLVLLLLTGTIDLPHAISFMSVDVIIFLVGMMVIVGLMRDSGFFRWLLAFGLRISRFEPTRLLLMLLFLSALSAALVDEVTSILFVSALILDLCDYYGVNPVKYIISAVLATNIGSSWTVLGNPIGILIALRSGLTFEDFLKMALPVGVIVLIALMVIVLIWQRGDLRLLKEKVKAKAAKSGAGFLEEWAVVKDRKLFLGSAILFGLVIISLALHYRLELLLGLAHNTLLVASSITGAGVVMLWQRQQAQKFITKDVDWWTLVFFMFLFAKAGTVQYVGLADRISQALTSITGVTGVSLLIVLVLWISGLLSSVLDNVVAVAAFIPVVASLTAQVGTPVLWWGLLFGGCYGGNMTMVGSTANIVALGILEKRKGYIMTFKRWIYIGLCGSLVPMAIGTVVLLIFS